VGARSTTITRARCRILNPTAPDSEMKVGDEASGARDAPAAASRPPAGPGWRWPPQGTGIARRRETDCSSLNPQGSPALSWVLDASGGREYEEGVFTPPSAPGPCKGHLHGQFRHGGGRPIRLGPAHRPAAQAGPPDHPRQGLATSRSMGRGPGSASRRGDET